jgi:hypothetical protein
LRGYTGMANAVVEAFQDGTVDDYQSAMQELVACFDGRDDERISLLADAGLGLAMQARLNQLLGDLADSYGRLQQLRCRRKRLASVGLGWLLNSRIQKSLAKCDELSRQCHCYERNTKTYAKKPSTDSEEVATERFRQMLARRSLEEAERGNSDEAIRLRQAAKASRPDSSGMLVGSPAGRD